MTKHEIGSMVKVRLGGQWHNAQVTDGPHKLSGHIEAKLKVGSKTIKTRFNPETEVKPIVEEVETLDEAHKINDTVIMSYPSLKGIKGRIGEIRHGAFKGAPKTYTIDYQHPMHSADHISSIQLKSTQFKAYKEGILGEEAETLDEMGYGQARNADYNFADSVPVQKQVTKKFLLKTKAGKLVSTHSNALDAVRARDKIGDFNTHSIVKEEVESSEEINEELEKKYPIGTKLRLKGNLKNVSSLGVNKQMYPGQAQKERWAVSQSSKSLFTGTNDSRNHGEVVGYHGDNIVVKSNHKSYGTDNQKHVIARPEHIRGVVGESTEHISELSIDTVKSYKAKVATNPAPSKTTSDILHKAIRRFAGKERAEDRIHHDKMVKMRPRLGIKEEVLDEVIKTEKPKHKVGDTVWATSPTNKALTMTGKVTKIGQTLTTVKHKDGSEAHYPHKLVSKEYSGLHSDPAKKYKQFQREHLEQTGELLSLKQIEESDVGQADGALKGPIAKASQKTGRVKTMSGNKTIAAKIAAILSKKV